MGYIRVRTVETDCGSHNGARAAGYLAKHVAGKIGLDDEEAWHLAVLQENGGYCLARDSATLAELLGAAPDLAVAVQLHLPRGCFCGVA